MNIKEIVKRLLCIVMASVLILGTSFSASAEVDEIADRNISNSLISINTEEKIKVKKNIDNIVGTENILNATPVVTEPIYDLEIDTGADSCEFCCDEGIESCYGVDSRINTEKTPEENDDTTVEFNVINTKFTGMFDVSFFAMNDEPYDTTQDTYFYYVMQGSCTDGEFDYFGYLVKQRIKVSDNPLKYENLQTGSGILCVKKGDDGKYTKIGNVRFPSLDTNENEINHVNDLTYNSRLNKIVIACCVQGLHNKLYLVSPAQLQCNEHLSKLDSVFVSCKVSSIDYNETRNSYVVGLSGANNRFAILDNDFDVVKKVGYSNLAYEQMVEDDNGNKKRWLRQACCSDNLRIYSIVFYEDESRDITYINENKIRVFDWSGNYINTIDINVTNGVDKIYEAENIFIKDDKVQIGFNCLRSRTITYCTLELSEIMFHIQYCPDENVDEYVGDFDNGNASSMIIRGIDTPLLKQRISKTGEVFLGWTAYRTEVDKWLYKSEDGITNAWYVAGEEPDGYTKYVYIDKQTVANTGKCGEHILMCAQWADTDKFYISFHSSATPKIISEQEIVYGVSTPLIANSFTKTNRTFQGWNAYWAEKNKWYYKDVYSSDKGWYKEGDQPIGYKKYLYLDKQSVAGTAYAGGHIQMHALWNEFYVQFDANTAIIENDNILVQSDFHYLEGNTNIIPFFSKGTINGKLVEITGYHLYRKEVDMWYYISADGKTKKWCCEGKQPNGYTLYVKAKPETGNNYLGVTAYPGEHLVLRAIWS